MKDRVLMKCGCVAQGMLTGVNGKKLDQPIPICTTHDCTESADNQDIPLAGREAVCCYRGSCKARQDKRGDTSYAKRYGPDGRAYAPSSKDLPFFEHKPTEPFDSFFCGCFGWD